MKIDEPLREGLPEGGGDWYFLVHDFAPSILVGALGFAGGNGLSFGDEGHGRSGRERCGGDPGAEVAGWEKGDVYAGL